MILNELFQLNEYKDKNLGYVINASKKAWNNLNYRSQRAIEEWESMNWMDGPLEMAYEGKNQEMVGDIDNAFAPVRELLRNIYGNNIRLYRGQRNYNNDELSSSERVLFSWTSELKIAKMFIHGKLYKEITDDEIRIAVDSFNKRGYAKVANRKYMLNKDNPAYYWIFDLRNEILTDGDTEHFERNLKDEQQERLKYNREWQSKGKVIEDIIPIDSIVWITNKLNCKEFICKYKPK